MLPLEQLGLLCPALSETPCVPRTLPMPAPWRVSCSLQPDVLRHHIVTLKIEKNLQTKSQEGQQALHPTVPTVPVIVLPFPLCTHSSATLPVLGAAQNQTQKTLG